jgi:hypothetical protein
MSVITTIVTRAFHGDDPARFFISRQIRINNVALAVCSPDITLHWRGISPGV